MKGLLSLLAAVTLIFTLTPCYAQSDAPLGSANAGLKVDYINFTDGDIGDVDADTGLYLGLNYYRNVSPNLYLGGEIGYAAPDGSVSELGAKLETEVTYIPIQFNAKYVMDQGNNLTVALGGGLSWNLVDVDLDATIAGFPGFPALSGSASDDDSLFGVQFSVDLNYTVDNYFVGANLEYQWTQDSDLFSGFIESDFSNWRIGVHAGLTF